jgi:3-deoxy-7-phosphoheptulonate synthase
MLWLGNRTRDPEEGHVEYLRGIENPVGIKVGPPYKNEEIVRVIQKLNPENMPGKIVLISRMGAKNVDTHLPDLIRMVNREGFDVCWSCDPMHGNTYSTADGIKTRHFDAILKEVVDTMAIHGAEGSILGGVHLELTGENVTECTGGAIGPDEAGLSANYQSFCDPRMNYEQSMELAFHIAREYNRQFPQKTDDKSQRMQALFEQD